MTPRQNRSGEPSLAACLIVRNEAAHLRACLESVRDAVDAIYVTDTGSTDGTPEVAKEFGAQVRSIPWPDDFAAARNGSLAGIEEEWILLLDADDLVAPGAGRNLPSALQAHCCAGTVRYVVDPAFTAVRAVKLVRNHLAARFEGIVHEDLSDWVAARKAEGWQVQALDFTVIHTGYGPDSLPAKAARNLPLLRQEWARIEPAGSVERRFFIGAELGLTLAQMGQREEAREFLAARWREALALQPAPLNGLHVMANLLWLLEEANEQEAALRIVQGAESSYGARLAYQLHRGLVELANGFHHRARTWLESFRERFTEEGVEIPVAAPFAGAGLCRALGLCRMGEQDYAAAAECFREAAALEPANEEHALRLLVAERMMSRDGVRV